MAAQIDAAWANEIESGSSSSDEDLPWALMNLWSDSANGRCSSDEGDEVTDVMHGRDQFLAPMDQSTESTIIWNSDDGHWTSGGSFDSTGDACTEVGSLSPQPVWAEISDGCAGSISESIKTMASANFCSNEPKNIGIKNRVQEQQCMYGLPDVESRKKMKPISMEEAERILQEGGGKLPPRPQSVDAGSYMHR
eukprot:SAG11_NODE_388_length_9871_cov_18.104585_6_plen_194_part_00